MAHDATWSAPDRLDDGTEVVFRLVRPDDKPLLERAFAQLSSESRFLRFFAAKSSLTDAELAYLTEMDQVRHVALGATTPDGSVGLGIARFVRCDDRADTAEAAVVVAEGMRQRGLGHRLLMHLVAAAHERGVTRFRCEILSTNQSMRAFVDPLPSPSSVKQEGEVLTYEWELPPPAQTPSAASRLLRLAGEGLLVLRHALFPGQERS